MNRPAAALLIALLTLASLQAAAYDQTDLDNIARRLASPSAEARDAGARDAYNAGAEAATVAPALVELIGRERDARVRKMAVRALGTTGKAHPPAASALAAVLRGDAEAAIRTDAAEALGELGAAGAAAVPALIAALGDAAPEVRQAAAKSLGAFPDGAARSVPALAGALADESVAIGGLPALRKLGPAAAAAVPALRRYVAAPQADEWLRASALWTLAAIGPASAAAAPECLALLEHRFAATRVAAAAALLAAGPWRDAAYKVLVAALATNQGRRDRAGMEERRDVVVDAARVLSKHGASADGAALSALAAAATDPISSEMSDAAAKAFDAVLSALVKAGRTDALPSLVESKRFLDASPNEENRARGLRLAAAIEQLERQRPALARLRPFVVPALAAIALLAAGLFGWLRLRRAAPHVFVSYRRQDSAAWCGRLYDHLVAGLGPGRVFRDVDSIAPGAPFAQRLQDAVAACDAFVVLIGPSWLGIADDTGRHRLDDPADFVRLEIEAALAAGRPLFPVLVEDARMPAAAELPLSLAALAGSNAMNLTDRHFATEVRRLVAAIRAVPRRPTQEGHR